MKKAEGKGYRSEIAGAVHEMMIGARDAGVVSREMLRTFDAMCLTLPRTPAGKDIRASRER